MELACPRCKRSPLTAAAGDRLACPAPDCGREYPVVGGVPILIHDENSVFAVADYASGAAYQGDAFHDGSGAAAPASRPGLLRRGYQRLARGLVYHSVGQDYLGSPAAVARALAAEGRLRVLVVGCGTTSYPAQDGLEVVATDVAFGPRAQVVCDAHDLPFPHGSFDMVVSVAVLEHVADPPRCVDEYRRVLRPQGYVYAATPFLQPVHMGAYDFTRFSHLGHRRLFRWFEELESGMALGPGAAAAWSLQYLLLSLTDDLRRRKLLRLLGLLATLPLKYADKLVRRKQGALDAAGGTYFFGRLAAAPIPDRELITRYRGRDGVRERAPDG